MKRRPPGCVQIHLRKTVVEKRECKQGDGLFAVADVKPARIGIAAKRGGLHIHFFGQGEKFINSFRRHGERHSLLGFGDQYFPGGKPWVFERRLGKVELAAPGDSRRFAYG